jgi:hypothetical protein
MVKDKKYLAEENSDSNVLVFGERKECEFEG